MDHAKLLCVGCTVKDWVYHLPGNGRLVEDYKYMQNRLPDDFAGGMASRISWLSAAVLKLNTYLVSTVGKDHDGIQIRRWLRHGGVNCRWLRLAPKRRTSQSFIVRSVRAKRTVFMSFDRALVKQRLVRRDMEKALNRVSWGCLDGAGNYDLQIRLGNEMSRRCIPFLINIERRGSACIKLLPRATVIVVAEQFVRQRAKVSAQKQLRFHEIKKWLNSLNTKARAIIVTLGGKGCVVLDRATGQSFHCPPYKAPGFKVLDSTGAGEGFAAGLLFGLHADWDLQETIRFATALASCVVETVGLPKRLSRKEIDRRCRSIKPVLLK